MPGLTSPAAPAGPSVASLPADVDAIILGAMPEEVAPFLTADSLSGEPVRVTAPLPQPMEAWYATYRLTAAATPTGSSTEPTAGSATEGVTERMAQVLVVRSGIGLVCAASALMAALRLASPRRVLSVGTAGGLGVGVHVGDVCVSTTLSYTDADATAFGYVRGQIPGQPAVFPSDDDAAALLGAWQDSPWPLHQGQMLSGNSFVTEANVADTREAFPQAVSTDMESAALAQVCAAMGLPFMSIRGVSDLCGPQAGEDFHIGTEIASAHSADVTLGLLARL